jgi:putative SOS response-associated peptidase YedK
MCNDYEQHVAWAAYCQAMQAIALNIPAHQTELDLPIADDVRISDLAPVMRAAGDVVELSRMKWGFPPAEGHKGGPVFNFRSEGRRFTKDQRLLIPASAFFEFIGKRTPKSKIRFTLNGAPFMAIAGLWRPGAGNQPDTFTMLTTEPGPDIDPFHARQVVVLPPALWRPWLEADQPVGDLLRPLAAGSLTAGVVREGKDAIPAGLFD